MIESEFLLHVQMTILSTLWKNAWNNIHWAKPNN